MWLNSKAARPAEKPLAVAKPWHFDPSIKPDAAKIKDHVLLQASKQDIEKVQEYYQHHAIPGHDIKSVEVIYNPAMNRSFSLKMKMLQARDNKPTFAPQWSTDGNTQERALRKAIHQKFQTLSAPYQDSDFPAIKLIPLWHGTSSKAVKDILETGYATLGIRDEGFFGRGIYSTHEADYACRVYSNGALILNWVATYSAYPVIDGDIDKLAGKGNFANYDAHFVPVVPKNPNDPTEVNYYPTVPQQKAQYHELVVFDSAQCLPRYLVTLQETLTHSLGNLGIVQKSVQAQPIIQSTSKPSAIDDKPKKESQPMLFSNSSQGKQTNLASSSSPKHQQSSPASSSSSGSNVLMFTPPPAKIVTTSLTIPKVNSQELTKFLDLVVQGEQDKAENMLKINKDLGLVPGDVTDLSKRTFKNITALQYAVWALDTHMWTMLLKYIPIEHAREQAKQVETGHWVAQHGLHANWDKLTNALKNLIDNLNHWNGDQINKHWVYEVGGAQLILPAHVINEYCHPARSFSPCPDFTKPEPNGAWRTRQTDKGEWFTCQFNEDTLGNMFAVARGTSVRAWADVYWKISSLDLDINIFIDNFSSDIALDHAGVRALYGARTQQRSRLLTELAPAKMQQLKAS